MSEKIMIVIGAPRRGGNTAFIARAVAAGAEAAGKEVAVVELAALKGFGQGCTSCYACQKSPDYRCVLRDEVSPVLESIRSYDKLVLAAPVYFFDAASQLKAFVDRLFCQFKEGKNGEILTPLKHLSIDLVMTAGAGRDDSGCETFLTAMKGTCDFLGLPEPALFFVGDCSVSVEALKNNQETINQAREFGANL